MQDSFRYNENPLYSHSLVEGIRGFFSTIKVRDTYPLGSYSIEERPTQSMIVNSKCQEKMTFNSFNVNFSLHLLSLIDAF